MIIETLLCGLLAISVIYALKKNLKIKKINCKESKELERVFQELTTNGRATTKDKHVAYSLSEYSEISVRKLGDLYVLTNLNKGIH